MPYVTGFLHVVEAGSPDNELPGGLGGRPDNSLPPGGLGGRPDRPDQGLPGFPGRPDNSLPGGRPERPDNSLPGVPPIGSTLPEQPPGVWPPIVPSHPIVPAPPGTPPGSIWPRPGRPNRPDNSLPGAPPRPDNSLPPSGGAPDNTLPTPPTTPPAPDNGLPSKTFWMLAYCPSLGWNFVAVDPSLDAGTPLPPTATPKPVPEEC